MNSALTIGNKVKITDGPRAGKEGYITSMDVDGSIEVRGVLEGGKYFTSRQFEFQLEKIDPDKGIETISYNERVCDNTCEAKSEPKQNDNPIKDSGERFSYIPWKVLLDIKEKYDSRLVDASVDEIIEVVEVFDRESFKKVMRVVGELKNIF